MHSSTLVTAGIYILIRYSLEEVHPLIAIGTATIIIAGLGGCTEGDIKKVVALRTLSQLGVIMIALRCARKALCFFHLVRHAIFKALLFMCVGTIIHSAYGRQEFRSFGKIRILLVPSTLLLVSNISLMGLPFLRGFYRKDSIYEFIVANGGAAYFFLLGVFLTAAYSTKIFTTALCNTNIANPAMSSLGALGHQVKGPILILGLFSVSWGNLMAAENLPLCLMIGADQKTLTLKLILLGVLVGILIRKKINRNKNPLRNIIFLAPSSQWTASGMILDPQDLEAK